MNLNPARNALLTDFGKATLQDRYLLPNETFQELFARVAKHFADDEEHAQRLYDAMSQLWFMPSTPILSNGGNSRGLPISCFLSEVTDNMEGIVDSWVENTWLACRGGGLGTYWGNVRSIGEPIGVVGKSSGVVPFLKVQDSLTLAVSQGALRRASSAVYMPISHPEIEEFIEIRRPTGGDPNRKCLNLHNAVVIDDEFMNAVVAGTEYALKSPKTKKVIKMVKARDLWMRILTARLETGEPYVMFVDNVNKDIPDHHQTLGLNVHMSNLCSEITLPTGIDHLGNMRTAVCCLASLNLETYDEWKDSPTLIPDVMRFLDNVLQDFIDNAPDSHSKAKYSAMRERSVGLGVMGLHGLYQQRGYAWESPEAERLNLEVFRLIDQEAVEANHMLGRERGACPDALDVDPNSTVRFSNCTSIAPTASISIICGGASAGVEPSLANCYLHKTLSGSFYVKNKRLEALLESKGMNTQEVWTNINANEGSVQQLDFLSDKEKDVFKTAFEINQECIIKQAAERGKYVDQAQSLNLFLPPNVSKKTLHSLHLEAWKSGLKTLYYCRSKAARQVEKISNKIERQVIPEQYQECQACQ